MKVTRKNDNTTITTSTLLTHAKRASLFYLIMPSFMFAIALSTQPVAAQQVEFILQFGTPEEDSTTTAQDVFAHSSGDVYIVGDTDGTLPGQTSEGDEDAFIRKYNSDGDEQWTRQFGTSEFDSARGVSVDSLSGDVYVVGSTSGTLPDQTSEEGLDAFIRKYNSDGDEQWTRQFGTSDLDEAAGVSVDSLSGDVYVVGSTSGTLPDQTSEGDEDAFIRKYNSDGDEQWTRQFGTSDSEQFVTGVSVDSSSDGVFVVGNTRGTFPGQTSQGDQDAFIRKYNSDGDEQWTRQFGTSEGIFVAGVSTDSEDGVYVAGSTSGTLPDQTSEENDGAFIRKYNSDGDEQWTRQFGTSEGIFVAGVSTDSEDGVYVAGNDGDSTFVYVRKYNLDGDVQWTRQFDTASSEDIVRGVSADASSVYVVGETGGTFPGQTKEGFIDAFLVKLIEHDDDEHDKRKKHHDVDDKKEKH